MRWEHPVHGLLHPAEFLPAAEASGVIVAVGTWAIEHACRQMAAWHGGSGSTLKLNLNLSARQFAEPTLPAQIKRVIGETGLAPGSVWLEITEATLLRDHDASDQALRLLHEIGVHLVIDDFGTGASSLVSLKHFPIDAIKIAATFVGRPRPGPRQRCHLQRDRRPRAFARLVRDRRRRRDAGAVRRAARARLRAGAGTPVRRGATRRGVRRQPRPRPSVSSARQKAPSVRASSGGFVRHPGSMRPVRRVCAPSACSPCSASCWAWCPACSRSAWAPRRRIPSRSQTDSIAWHGVQRRFPVRHAHRAPRPGGVRLADVGPRRRAPPAREPDDRIGSLVVNPGGPGAPAVAFLTAIAESLPRSCATVSTSWRSTRAASATAARSSASTRLDPVFDEPFQPTTARRARRPGRGHAERWRRQCAARSGDLLPARVDRRRGRRSRTPADRAGRRRSSRSSDTRTARSSARATPMRIPTVCARSCSTGRSTRRWPRTRSTLGPGARLRARARQLPRRLLGAPGLRVPPRGSRRPRVRRAAGPRPASAPLATDDVDGRVLNQTRFDAAVLQQLYLGRSSWPALADALRDADEGDASTLLAGADAFVGRDGDGARRPRRSRPSGRSPA